MDRTRGVSMIGLTVLDVEVDVSSALSYYYEIEKNYQKQKWMIDNKFSHELNDASDPNHFSDSYAWAIDTVNDPADPFHMFEAPYERDYSKFKRTVCCFGWAEKALNFFPKSYRLQLAVSTPGTRIAKHTDYEGKIKIHIPIQTNKDCIWELEDGEFALPAGKVYVLDVTKPHGTINRSKSNRVHFVLEMLKKDSDYLYSLGGKL